jgi:hypothetical protein
MSFRGRGGIGRHDGLKIRCLVIEREGSSPSVPILKVKYSNLNQKKIILFIIK